MYAQQQRGPGNYFSESKNKNNINHSRLNIIESEINKIMKHQNQGSINNKSKSNQRLTDLIEQYNKLSGIKKGGYRTRNNFKKYNNTRKNRKA